MRAKDADLQQLRLVLGMYITHLSFHSSYYHYLILVLIIIIIDGNRDDQIERRELEKFCEWFPLTAEERYKRVTKPTSEIVKEWTISAVADLLRQE